jgi:hypothetical protein
MDRGLPLNERKSQTLKEGNLNANWVNSRGAWASNIFFIVIIRIAVGLIVKNTNKAHIINRITMDPDKFDI